MIKFNRILLRTSKNFIKTACQRTSSTEIEHKQLSQRELQLLEAREIYKNHSQILYSSYLEAEARALPNRNQIKTQKNVISMHNFDFPNNWMDDYEFYEGGVDEEGNVNSKHGTADPSILPSTVPCNGCGAYLHCASTAVPGYIPKEIFKGRTVKELQTIICQRCHFLKHYNIALDVEVAPEKYIETISSIENQFALAILIVDLLDFPCSIWPGMQEILGKKRPVIVVGNKVDLLPRDSNNYLKYIKECLQQELIDLGFNQLNLKYVSLISAKTGYGIEELITQLHNIWKYKGNVYLLGCTNVGKSSLFNILLNSDYCRPEASELVRKATTCPWPGTTLNMLKFPILRPSDIRIYQRYKRLFSEQAQRNAAQKLRHDQAKQTGSIQAAQLIGNIGRTFDKRSEAQDVFAMGTGTKPIVTLNEKSRELKESRWCFDTPGVLSPEHITNLLTTEELLKLKPTQMISPRAYRIKPNMSLFLGGLARLDFIDIQNNTKDLVKAFVFSSPELPILITNLNDADEVYKKYLGTNILGIPTSGERLSRWPGLKCKSEDLNVVGQYEDALSCDIVLSSAGWVGLSLPDGAECKFRAWSPYARGIHVRNMALVPLADRLIGKHIRHTLAYHTAKPFVFKK